MTLLVEDWQELSASFWRLSLVACCLAGKPGPLISSLWVAGLTFSGDWLAERPKPKLHVFGYNTNFRILSPVTSRLFMLVLCEYDRLPFGQAHRLIQLTTLVYGLGVDFGSCRRRT